jgi:hypothetical protein
VAATPVPAPTPQAPYQALFLAFALVLLAGTLIYAFSRDRLD